jgi:quercetin dioxygenase-like cupin family protein
MNLTDLSTLPSREILPGYHARFVHGKTMTQAFWEIDSGSEIPAHEHEHEQILFVREGRFELTAGGAKEVLGAGAVVVIPSGVVHGGRALTDCRIIDTFHPVRRDFVESDQSNDGTEFPAHAPGNPPTNGTGV